MTAGLRGSGESQQTGERWPVEQGKRETRELEKDGWDFGFGHESCGKEWKTGKEKKEEDPRLGVEGLEKKLWLVAEGAWTSERKVTGKEALVDGQAEQRNEGDRKGNGKGKG